MSCRARLWPPAAHGSDGVEAVADCGSSPVLVDKGCGGGDEG